MNKPCYRCGQVKDESEFFRNVLTADRLSFHCKACTRIATRVNPNATRRKAATYSPKREAHKAVNAAIKDGRLERKPCALCGSEPTEAHHTDYARRLDVVWLCRSHHRKVHSAYGIPGLTDEQIAMVTPISATYEQSRSV
jgi:hypothetical protein